MLIADMIVVDNKNAQYPKNIDHRTIVVTDAIGTVVNFDSSRAALYFWLCIIVFNNC